MKDEIKIVYQKRYKGRNLVVKKFSPTEHVRGWFTGYVELLPGDDFDFPIISNDPNVLSAFESFPGGVTFRDPLQDMDDNSIYVGFDTMHWGMENLNENDCIKALKKTVDRLENL